MDSKVVVAPGPLRWNELESEDYPTFVANLRKAGCPEPVVRRIISAEIKQHFAQKTFALVQKFHHDFWKIAAQENIRQYFEKKLGQQAKALCQESDALLKQIVGEDSREPSSEPKSSAPRSRLMDFLPIAKQEQLLRLIESYEARQQAVREANLSPKEKEFQLAQLYREMEKEQAEMLLPEELAEYHLRQSDAAKEVQRLYGVDFTETELRNLAKAIDDYHRRANSQVETDPAALEQKLQTVLGPERFVDFSRACSASYRDIYEVVSDFGLPDATAAEIFDLRLKSEKQSDEIRSDKNRSTEEKQTLLDELGEQVEQTVVTRLGTGAYQNYKARGGRWINSLYRL